MKEKLTVFRSAGGRSVKNLENPGCFREVVIKTVYFYGCTSESAIQGSVYISCGQGCFQSAWAAVGVTWCGFEGVA
jgi:hypothetical protein